MKKQISQRILSLTLVLVMLLGLFPMGSIPTAQAATDEFGVENNGYIDLPVQVLDFRGDGFMFESSSCWGSAYSLTWHPSYGRSPSGISINTNLDENFQTYGGRTNGEPLTNTANFIWAREDLQSTWNNDRDAFAIVGLVEDTLRGDRIAYTEDALIYIAYAIFSNHHIRDEAVLNADKTLSGNRWLNMAFTQKYKEGLPLGSPSHTYSRTSTGENGGSLAWNDVETTFDLAYYMLSNIWNKVPENEYLDEVKVGDELIGATYNMEIPEIQKMRFYKVANDDGTYYYLYDSAGTDSIQDGVLYTSSSAKDNHGDSSSTPVPHFHPLENLGFEKYFADSGKLINTNGNWNVGNPNANYLFTLRANGGFVYHEESELFFEFLGDDDVYFFINGKLITDIGGVHGSAYRSLDLNTANKEMNLGLVDGQICTFDMFYADRHTTGINLKLSTNIELMDYDLLTQKKQFDATTGVEYYNGKAVPFGTKLDYQFSILNRKTLPARDVVFSDSNLGVELSKEIVKLSSAETYSDQEDLSHKDLWVTYTPYSKDGYGGTVETVHDVSVLQQAILPYISVTELNVEALPKIEQGYRYQIKTAQELMDILEMGVPGFCEFAVYGVERTLQQSNPGNDPLVIVSGQNGIYTNTLNSFVSPATIVNGADGEPEILFASPVSGVSTCRIKGFTLGDVSVTEPMQVVLDYGKPVDIDLDSMVSAVNHSRNSFALRVIGFELPKEGERASKNGYVEVKEPTNLILTATDNTAPGVNGAFRRLSEKNLRFTMDGFLSDVERIYAVASIAPLDDPEGGSGTGTESQGILAYIYLEIQIIPATMVYYEAEDFTDTELSYTQKTTLETDTVDYLYFDFGGVSSPFLMDSSTMGGKDWEAYEVKDGKNVLTNWVTGASHNSNGVAELITEESAAYLPKLNIKSGFYSKGLDLNFPIPAGSNYVIEVRLKVDNLNADDEDIKFFAYYASSGTVSTNLEDIPNLPEGEFVVLNKNLSTAAREKTIYSVGIRSVSPNTEGEYATGIYIDYIYVGPPEKAPSYLENMEQTDSRAYLFEGLQYITRWDSETDLTYPRNTNIQDLNSLGQEIYHPDYTGNNDVLFFDFENTAEDRERYNSAIYGKRGNYDDPALVNQLWYTYQERSAKVLKKEIKPDIGAMVITARSQAGNSGTDAYPDIFLDTIYGGNPLANTYEGFYNSGLNYKPQNAEVYQVRFKMKNFRIGTNGNAADSPVANPFITMEYTSSTPGTKPLSLTRITWSSLSRLNPDLLNGDEYLVMTIPVDSAFRQTANITRIRAYWGGLESISASQLGELTIDYIYIGPRALAPVETAYGWDSSYMDDPLLSNGESLYVEGKGVRVDTNPDPKNLTEIKFEFEGTGFDIISRTGEQQATFRVEIFTDPSRSIESRIEGRAINLKGEMEMYQIPVYSKHGLPYDKYYVSLMVNEAKNYPFFPALNRGGQFYLDAIRIYDPIDVSAGKNAAVGSDSAIAYSAYCADGEAHAVIDEVRDILIPAADFHVLDGATTGAIFVDYSEIPEVTVAVTTPDGEVTDETIVVPTVPGLDVKDHVTSSVETYTKVGPNNETYLGQQQLVSFMLVVYSNEIPTRVDIGCKTIDATGSNLRASITKGSGTIAGIIESPVKSSTAQYHSLPMWKELFNEGTYKGKACYYAYIQIENTTPKNASATDKNVLSITDIKIAYNQEPTAKVGDGTASVAEVLSLRGATGNGAVELPTDEFDPVDFVVDSSVAEIVKELLEDRFDPECKHIPGPWDTVEEAAPGQNGLMKQYCTLCGEVLGEMVVEGTPELKFAGAAVSLQTDLAIHYKVNESFFTEGGYTDPYVVVVDNGIETVIRDYTVSGGRLSFAYKNIAPHRTGDTVTATLYAYHDGKLYSSESKDYSIADYCYNMLGRYGENPDYATLNTLLVDLLLYGAESQKYTKYHTDNLCTARLTEEQLAWGTELHRELVSCKDQMYQVIDNPTVEWKGAGLNLHESVAVRFKIVTDSYEGIEVKITMDGWTQTVKAEDFDYRADGAYVHFNGLNAAQLSSPIYVTAYREGVQVSNTICYSVESYAYAKQNDTTVPYLASLVKRMMCYGDSARAYVGK